MIAEQLKTLRTSCDECIDNGSPVQVPDAMSPGDMLVQGDVGLLMIERLPYRAKSIQWPKDGGMQIAPGMSRGSRHTIPRRCMEHVKLFELSDGDRLSNLAIVSDAPFDLEHPEHANHIGYPPGIYRVCHEQNEARERVLD